MQNLLLFVSLLLRASGVDKVRSETDANKLTVVGAVDPSKIREKLQQKTKKVVDLISPLPKKENNSKDSKQENKKSDDKKQDKDKKPKEVIQLFN